MLQSKGSQGPVVGQQARQRAFAPAKGRVLPHHVIRQQQWLRHGPNPLRVSSAESRPLDKQRFVQHKAEAYTFYR